jgi:hypothetical protein
MLLFFFSLVWLFLNINDGYSFGCHCLNCCPSFSCQNLWGLLQVVFDIQWMQTCLYHLFETWVWVFRKIFARFITSLPRWLSLMGMGFLTIPEHTSYSVFSVCRSLFAFFSFVAILLHVLLRIAASGYPIGNKSFKSCEFESWSQFFRQLRQDSGFRRELRFPPPIKLTSMMDLKLFGSIHPNWTTSARCPTLELSTHDTQQHTACFTALGPALP